MAKSGVGVFKASASFAFAVGKTPYDGDNDEKYLIQCAQWKIGTCPSAGAFLFDRGG